MQNVAVACDCYEKLQIGKVNIENEKKITKKLLLKKDKHKDI